MFCKNVFFFVFFFYSYIDFTSSTFLEIVVLSSRCMKLKLIEKTKINCMFLSPGMSTKSKRKKEQVFLLLLFFVRLKFQADWNFRRFESIEWSGISQSRKQQRERGPVAMVQRSFFHRRFSKKREDLKEKLLSLIDE